MRIAFAGTPPFARSALQAIVAAGHEVPLVLTQPDKPSGRGLKTRATAVGEWAAQHGLAVATPRSLRADPDAREALERLYAAEPDLLVVAAYGLILPQRVLDAPRGIEGRSGRARAVNIHASLLPRWRGAAPVARAIEAGDPTTGIALMQMDAGLDTGPVLATTSLRIEASDTAASLTERLAQLGARMAVQWLRDAPTGDWQAGPQPAEGVTYAHKIGKHEAWLDWCEPADLLARRVRAFDPQPGAVGMLEGRLLKIWAAQARRETDCVAPGTVLASGADGIVVACGDGALVIHELQKAGGRRLSAREFLAGANVAVGARWQHKPEPEPSAAG